MERRTVFSALAAGMAAQGATFSNPFAQTFLKSFVAHWVDTREYSLAVLDANGALPQVLISDIHMPGDSGLVLLQRVKEKHPSLPVIIMTAYSDLDSAVAAFQGGAFEYLPKPFDVDQALDLLQRALKESTHQVGADESSTTVPEILGQATSMQEVFRAIGRLSQSSATVMITPRRSG